MRPYDWLRAEDEPPVHHITEYRGIRQLEDDLPVRIVFIERDEYRVMTFVDSTGRVLGVEKKGALIGVDDLLAVLGAIRVQQQPEVDE